MNQIILASHGGLAAGAYDTLSMVLGSVSNVHVVSLQRDDVNPITQEVIALMEGFDKSDDVYVCTDMLGSSVNNAMVELMGNYGRMTVISGMNMPLILGLAVSPTPVHGKELSELIRESRRGLRDCAEDIEEDRRQPITERRANQVSTSGKANIALVRLDYRLLHGQVVFSWVNSIGAQRIIVVDNEAASDEMKKNALKLAKPAGVRLNIFSVEKALAKMDKLNTLGETVMFIFGNVHELVEFCALHPFPVINFGAAANHEGAQAVGGKDSSVFLDASEREDAQKLLEMGSQIFEQQTPTQARTQITSFR